MSSEVWQHSAVHSVHVPISDCNGNISKQYLLLTHVSLIGTIYYGMYVVIVCEYTNNVCSNESVDVSIGVYELGTYLYIHFCSAILYYLVHTIN